MGIKTVPHPPYNPDLAPCDFWLFPKMTGCHWDNWRDERSCDEGHWHAHTRGLPWGLPEVVETVQVHCSRRRLLRKGLEFPVCTINKSAHTKKVWKLIACSSYTQVMKPVRWRSRIRWLNLCRGVRSPLLNKCPGNNTKLQKRFPLTICLIWFVSVFV